MNVWVRFALVQIVMFVFWVVGIVALIAPCVCKAWETSPVPSIKDGKRIIDRWSWAWVRWLGLSNPEDGDSGQMALVHGDQPYMPPGAWRERVKPLWLKSTLNYLLDVWRAYWWSAWRNSADGWKYRFAYEQGLLKEFVVLGVSHKIGWQRENGVKVPVIS